MTAIAGVWRLDGRPDAAEACAAMLEPLRMYGPDDAGTWADPDIAVGRCLMRTLPEDTFDRQPLVGPSGCVLVADLRLDNRDELGSALGLAGESLCNSSDAAVLLAAYERWGVACLDHVIGDYAFAIWDPARRRLILARDPVGMRPLYYHRSRSLFAFASMPKGLHALPEVPCAANETQVARFLALMPDHGSSTFFEGVEKIEAAHLAIVGQTALTVRRHWEPSRQVLRLGSPDEYAEGLREQLDRAVRRRLRGATSVATQLSSGYDSSAVTATAARLLAPDGGRVYAFTAVPREGIESGPANRLDDEGPLASETAALHPNIEHVLVRAGGRSPLAGLDRSFQLYERPMLNLCNMVWIEAIQDGARDRGLTVLLTGASGNMTVSYDGFELLPELVRAGRMMSWLREARAMRAQGTSWRGLLWRSAGPWMPRQVRRRLKRRSSVSRPNGLSMLRPERLAELDPSASEDLLDVAHADSVATRLWVLRRGSRGSYQKGVLAGWRIEVRDPTADQRLLEFCLATPTDQFLRNGMPRALARRALADRVPAAVLDSRRKGYQAADWHMGLTAARDSVAEEIDRLSACAPAVRLLTIERMRRLLQDWPASGWGRPEIVESYRRALLRGISAGHFLRRAQAPSAE